MSKGIEVGDKIPYFVLCDQNGKNFNSDTDVKGKITVIYFYPKDDSGVCTKEACAFRDGYQHFTDAGIEVVGINAADAESHKRFAEKNRLPFKLLSDAGNKVIRQFGVKNLMFLTGRETFIINDLGIVIYKFRDFFKGAAHAGAILQFLNHEK